MPKKMSKVYYVDPEVRLVDYERAIRSIRRANGTRDLVMENIYEAQIELALNLENYTYVFDYIAYLEETEQYDKAVEVATRLVNSLNECEHYNNNLLHAVDILETLLYENDIEISDEEEERFLYLRSKVYSC